MNKILVSLFALFFLGVLFTGPAYALTNSAQSVRIEYSDENVTTDAYTEVVAQTARAVKGITVLNTGVNAKIIAIGSAGNEQDQIMVPGTNPDEYFPGATSVTQVPTFYPLAISQGVRISIKSESSDETEGNFQLNYFFY